MKVMSINEFIDKKAPKTEKDVLKSCLYYYNFEPVVNSFVDHVTVYKGRQIDDEELVEILRPFLQRLMYVDYCKQIAKKLEKGKKK